MLKLADENHNQVLLVRTPRRTAYLDRWKALPEESFAHYDEPGRYTGAPAKRIHVAETTTPVRADKHSPTRQVRTSVAREEKRRGNDRWHALFVFRDNATDALALIKEFRARQHHEQAYRVLLHDAFVDTVPSGYNKKSRNPDRPGFRKNAITLYAWVTGLAVNVLTSLTTALPKRFKLAHPRPLRRWWLNFPADLYLTDRPSSSSSTRSGFAAGGSRRSSSSTPRSCGCRGWTTASSCTLSTRRSPRTRNRHAIPRPEHQAFLSRGAISSPFKPGDRQLNRSPDRRPVIGASLF